VSRGPPPRKGADFGAINERRKLALAVFDWCAACGMPFDDELRLQVSTFFAKTRPMTMTRWDSVRLPSTRYAPSTRPRYARARHPRTRGSATSTEQASAREPTVKLGGFRRTTWVEAHPSSTQPSVSKLAFGQAWEVDHFPYAPPEELGERYRRLRRDEADIIVKPSEAKLITLFQLRGRRER